jgi:hypothetical protein
MNNPVRFVIVLSLCLLCQCNSNIESRYEDEMEKSSGACLPDVKDRYAYPVVPGMKEWGELSSYDEAIRVCQLPDKVLKNISTLGLLRSILDIPLLSETFYVSNDNRTLVRLNRIYELFNSSMDFIRRKDAVEALLAYCNLVSFDCLSRLETHELMNFSVQIAALEGLYTCSEILGQTDSQKKRQVVASVLSLYRQMRNANCDDFASIDVMGCVMYADRYSSVVNYVDEKGRHYDPQIGISFYAEDVDHIISFAESYIH